MTRHENILSFDEARARGSVSPRSPQARVSQTRFTPQQNTPTHVPVNAQTNVPAGAHAHRRAASAARNPYATQQGRAVASRDLYAAQQSNHASARNAHTAYRSAQPFSISQRNASAARAGMSTTHQPQRLTRDPSFERSFTATPQSGSYAGAHRKASSARSHAAKVGQGAYQLNHASARSSQAFSQQSGAMQMDRPLEEEPLDNASQQTVDRKSDKKSLAHRVRSAKAERQFNKRFGSDEPVKPGPDQSSRPALYEMKMGKSHKRSTRMQDVARGKKKSSGILARLASVFAIFNPRSTRFSSRALITCAAMAMAVVMLYQPVANYYQEVRQQQQLEAEYAVVADYYSNLKSEVEYLNTKEGLEEFVREELGWVKAGEQVATVEGLAPRDGAEKKGSITADLSNAVPTPVTWYSPVLDVLLGNTKP